MGVTEDEMAEVEFREAVKDFTRKEKTKYVYRHARTGRQSLLQDAGKPWTVKAEQRQKPVSVYVQDACDACTPPPPYWS